MSVTKSDSEKLDEILKTLLQINKRMDNFENKLEGFNTRLTSLNQKLDDRYDELKSQIDNKAYVTDVEEVSERLKILEAKAHDRKNKGLMLESYEKRFNLLIHGIDENYRYAWETREQTKHLVENFIKEGLKIEDPSKIAMAGCHRLPQRVILKNKMRVNRPIIMKLTNADDKLLIFSHLKNLKIYNNTRISQFENAICYSSITGTVSKRT